MSQKRKICVVTGTRAEYGLLYWLMKEIQDDSDLQLQIIATGMHLSEEFGATYRVIESDGFKINAKVDLNLNDDSPLGIARSIGLGVAGFAEAYSILKPDIIVLLGDRYELLAAAETALVMKIPVAHIHGGETTEGAIDEAMRHSITKMSHLHFVAHDDYKNRVIQLGESPDRVFNYGTIGLDHLSKTKLLDKAELEKSIDFKLGETNLLVTYHPATLGKISSKEAMTNLLHALDGFSNSKIIFTKSNSDTDGKIINQMIEEYCSNNRNQRIAFASLGQQRYLSALKLVDVVIGNSSSGIIEAPALNTPTVNIGDRQKGRLRASSIVDCNDDASSISSAIKEAMTAKFDYTDSPYKAGNTSIRIKDQLKAAQIENILVKKFYDLKK